MILADRLKKSVEEILHFTTLELKLWAGYMLYEHNEGKKLWATTTYQRHDLGEDNGY